MNAEGMQDDAEHFSAARRASLSGSDQGLEQLAQWKAHFTRQLMALLLNQDIFEVLMKAMDEHPELFHDSAGRLLRFDAWRTAVLDGRWTLDGGYREHQSGCPQRLGSVLDAVYGLCRPRLIH